MSLQMYLKQPQASQQAINGMQPFRQGIVVGKRDQHWLQYFIASWLFARQYQRACRLSRHTSLSLTETENLEWLETTEMDKVAGGKDGGPESRCSMIMAKLEKQWQELHHEQFFGAALAVALPFIED